MTQGQRDCGTDTTPYTPSCEPAWTLYVSSDLAYLSFNGQMRATTGYRTPAEQVRVDGLVARLRASTDAEAVQREMMEEAGRRRPDSIDDARYGDERHYYDD